MNNNKYNSKKRSDIKPLSVDLYFIPVETRVPLKFGRETLASVICARTCITVADEQGQTAQGWGETPLSVQWAWPSNLVYQERCETMQLFCRMLAKEWARFDRQGHPIELGSDFIESQLPTLLEKLNGRRGEQTEPMPHLAALVCCSAFDIPLHDGYGQLLSRDVYSTYNAEFMNVDLSYFLAPADDVDFSFAGKYPADFLNFPPAKTLPAWHLVGGKDLLDVSELPGPEPDDGYPVLLPDWIKRAGLKCLKVKLRGYDSFWDYDRLLKVGKIAIEHNVLWLTSAFNTTGSEPA